MGGPLGVNASCFHVQGKLGKSRCCLLRDAGSGFFRAKLFRITKESSKNFERRQCTIWGRFVGKQIAQREAVDVLCGSGEVGMHLEAVMVANNKQWWIFQVFSIL